MNVTEIFFNFKQYNYAGIYLKNINEPLFFEYKMDMLKYLEPEYALEVYIADKTISNVSDYVKDIISKKPKLINKAKELAEKYKVTLELD